MTSNLGSDVIQELAGKGDYRALKKAAMEIVTRHFRPEFLNRIDDSVVFHPLSQANIAAITKIQIELLQRRLHQRNMKLELDDAALLFLAEGGYDPVYGARPLKREIQTRLENPLAQDILSGKFLPGDTIKVAVDNNQLVFKRV